MPLEAMTEEVIAEWTEKMSPDLLLQLQRSMVTPHTIAVLAKSRFVNVTRFQMVADDPAGVKKRQKCSA